MRQRIIFGGNSDIGRAIPGLKISRKRCDITSQSEVFDTIKMLKPEEIVNCAGVIYPSDILDVDPKKEIAVNLLGSFNVARYGCEAKLVFIGSTSGLRGRAGWSGYCASKAGVISLVQSLAEEGYDAWCVSPARTKTKMRKKLFPDEDQNSLLKPADVAKVVEDCFSGKYQSGSNIILRQNGKIEVQN